MKNKNKQTKFPVARIKKIMQKDEEVGKVASATPVAISKALELFLQHIVETSCKVTESRGSKRIESYHLKHAINTNEMLDFLKEIVENVPDPTNGGTISEDVDGEGRKRRRGRGPAKEKGKSRSKKEVKTEPEVAPESMDQDEEEEDDEDD